MRTKRADGTPRDAYAFSDVVGGESIFDGGKDALLGGAGKLAHALEDLASFARGPYAPLAPCFFA